MMSTTMMIMTTTMTLMAIMLQTYTSSIIVKSLDFEEFVPPVRFLLFFTHVLVVCERDDITLTPRSPDPSPALHTVHLASFYQRPNRWTLFLSVLYLHKPRGQKGSEVTRCNRFFEQKGHATFF